MALRKVWRSGNSLVITLPLEYCEKHKLSPGSLIQILDMRGGLTVLKPIGNWKPTSPPHMTRTSKK